MLTLLVVCFCLAPLLARTAIQPPSHIKPVLGRNRCELYLEDADLYPRAAPRQLKFDVVNASTLTGESFDALYRRPQKLVLVKGAGQALFGEAGASRLSVEALLKHPQVDEEQYVTTRASRIAHRGNGRPENFQTMRSVLTGNKRAVLFHARLFSELEAGRTVQPVVAKLSASMSTSLRFQKSFYDSLRNDMFLSNQSKTFHRDKSKFNVHISSMGGAMPHHHGATFNILFQGVKRWLLTDLAELEKAGIHHKSYEEWDKYPFGEDAEYSAQQWFLGPNGQAPPVPHYSVLQEEGDGLFIPDFHSHATIDLCKQTVGVVLTGPVVTGRDGIHIQDTSRWVSQEQNGSRWQLYSLILKLIGVLCCACVTHFFVRYYVWRKKRIRMQKQN